jgi:hypothetical protein
LKLLLDYLQCTLSISVSMPQMLEGYDTKMESSHKRQFAGKHEVSCETKLIISSC